MSVVRLDATSAPLLATLHELSAAGRPWREAEFARLLEAPGAFAFAAPAGEPQGFVLGWTIGAEAEIHFIGVAPAARRAGIGRALLAAACAAAREDGALQLILEVAEDNAPARALYEGAGFVPIGRRKGYYENGAIDAVVLARRLD